MNEELIKYISERVLFYINSNDNNLELFIKNLGNNLVKILGLKEYGKEINILEVYDGSEERKDSRGLIDKDNNICLFKQGIEKTLETILEKIPVLSSNEIEFLKIFLYLKTLLHELGHLNEKRLLAKNNMDSIETIIVKLCTQKREEDEFLYKIFYEYYPTERLAEISALRNLVKVLKTLETKIDIELLIYYMEKEVIREELIAYPVYGLCGPTESLFKRWYKDLWPRFQDAIKNKENMKYEERVLYGIEISESEFNVRISRNKELEMKISEIITNRGR